MKQDIREALTDTPLVPVTGAQAGKTTLARTMEESRRTYITLDDQTVRSVAGPDPAGFVRGLQLAIIDEIQRTPESLLAIKQSVYEDGRPGRFPLTGPANPMNLRNVEDSLAGRVEVIHLLPLSRVEIEGASPTFLGRLFDGNLESDHSSAVDDELIRPVLLGGFPEAVRREKRESTGFLS